MAAEDKERTPCSLSEVKTTTTRYTGGDLRGLMKLVAAEKRTGKLTIHFNQGGFSMCEWEQKEK
jgi:hypothetical protein